MDGPRLGEDRVPYTGLAGLDASSVGRVAARRSVRYK